MSAQIAQMNPAGLSTDLITLELKRSISASVHCLILSQFTASPYLTPVFMVSMPYDLASFVLSASLRSNLLVRCVHLHPPQLHLGLHND
jgi:hypothetical protein